jgi:hypothetical protein
VKGVIPDVRVEVDAQTVDLHLRTRRIDTITQGRNGTVD